MLTEHRSLVFANVLSASRGLLALVLLGLYLLHAPSWVLVACAGVMWATDALDGMVARSGLRRGAPQRVDGQIIDPLMDNAALFVGFAILLDASVVPVWFVAALAISRVLFSAVRMIGLAQKAVFAKPQISTKLSGACLGVGQCVLLVNIYADNSTLSSSSVDMIVYAMSFVLALSLYRFLLVKHRRLLLSLFKSQEHV